MFYCNGKSIFPFIISCKYLTTTRQYDFISDRTLGAPIFEKYIFSQYYYLLPESFIVAQSTFLSFFMDYIRQNSDESS